MRKIVPTSCDSLDEQLGGGLLEGNTVLIYGEAETGKTTFAIQCAVNCARAGYKTIFIDCDRTFFPRRMAQISGKDFNILAPQIILMRPEDFGQQTYVIENLNQYISKKVGLIAVDTITSLYREKLTSRAQTFTLNRELNRQMAYLAQLTKTQKVATLIASQVRSLLIDHDDTVQPVASRVLRFWADFTMKLYPTAKSQIIKAKVKTNDGKRSGKPIFLKISKEGLHEYKK
ncbi:MAG: AAA family ATPase [Candidatus Bathyarchaeota archaeon]|nr:AAA family ATPase [Candidatus Bathyarchaeota archaeon]